MSLEDAAEKVKISKKSLDDYLMQLRSAKKFGFDFDRHIKDKVGVIRSFVRQKKQEERALKGKKVSKAQAKKAAQNSADAAATPKVTKISSSKQVTVQPETPPSSRLTNSHSPVLTRRQRKTNGFKLQSTTSPEELFGKKK